MSAPDRARHPGRVWPGLSNAQYYSEGTPFGPAVGPSERRRRRDEGQKFEKAMNKEAERGDENWPPTPKLGE